MSGADPTTDDADGLKAYFPDELQAADEINWEALANEIGEHISFYLLPTTPDGDDEQWVDKLELCQDVSRHCRDGGEVDMDRVIADG